MRSAVLAALLATAAQGPPSAVIVDPPADRAHPAAMRAMVIPSAGAGLNTVVYTAAGAGPHPALLLLHGFPGNEQNLDLAQAARRAGWTVVTFHYRGSWGSGGAFSFAHCVEDARNVVAYLRKADSAARLGVDPARIAVAGHSMGGIVAARVAADDPRILGAFLIDPADFAAIGRSFADPKAREDFLVNEVRGDMPPLAGTSEEAIMAEVAAMPASLDLVATMPALAGRPLALIGAERGIGAMSVPAAAAARRARAKRLDAETWPTDHSFSGMRIALAGKLVGWLQELR